MTPELSHELRQAVHQLGGTQPLKLIDPDTNTLYVLVRAEVFEQAQSSQSGANELSDSYSAQSESAMRAGWSDPTMDAYDNYDESRSKQCP
jgi:hypothetical protein